jgi:hypothetical protein
MPLANVSSHGASAFGVGGGSRGVVGGVDLGVLVGLGDEGGVTSGVGDAFDVVGVGETSCVVVGRGEDPQPRTRITHATRPIRRVICVRYDARP